MSDYLIYTNLDDALEKAETEGSRRNYSYYKVGRGTRYKTSPEETADGNYALDVTEYELTEDEKSAITNSVTFPTPEAP